MTKLEYEVWRLGPARRDDRCLLRFGKLADAVRELDRRRAMDDGELYEVRRLGDPFDADRAVNKHERSTRPRMPVIRESDPGALRSTIPGDDDEEERSA